MTPHPCTTPPNREPLSANARAGFIVAVSCWVLLTMVVAFLHHLLFSQTSVVVGGEQSQLKMAFLGWIPHSALGYLLLTTIAIDVFIDIQDARVNHRHAWLTLGTVVLASLALVALDVFLSDASGIVPVASLLACLPLKYFSLRDYKW